MFSRNTMPSPDDPFNPKWKLIPQNNMDPPYGALGLVRVLSTEKRSPGTCWLAGNNIAITAAMLSSRRVNPAHRLK